MNFFFNFAPNPILATIGPITIHWYGFIVAMALLVAVSVATKLAKNHKLKLDDVLDLSLWLIISGVLGARIYDVLIVDWSYFSQHWNEILYIWQGGLAIHGGILGGLIALIIWCKINKQSIWLWLDIGAVVLPLAQAIGRFGNYFNSELFGGPTNLPWGIFIDIKNRPEQFIGYSYFHPAFLYEAILNLALFILLLIFYKKNRLQSGQIASLYLIGYGLIRFLMEFIRIDETGLMAGIRIPQLMSLIFIVSGIIIYRNKKLPR